MEATESSLIKEATPDSEVNAGNLEKVSELLAFAIARDAKHKDCAGLASCQVGMRTRALVFFDHEKADWVKCLNPAITATKGDKFSQLRSIINLPNKYIRAEVFPVCTMDWEDEIGRPTSAEFKGDTAIVLQFLCMMLDGRFPEILNRDFRTIKAERKLGPNDRCPKCGKKCKKCVCVETHNV